MKRISIITLLALVGTFGLQAQSSDLPRSGFQRSQLLFSPVYLFDATFMMSYEQPLSRSGALRITPSITLEDNGYDSREGFGIDLGYKVFLLRNSRVINFYVGPYAYYNHLKSTGSYNYNRLYYRDTLGFGIDTGVKCIFGRFVIDFTLGGGIKYPLNANSNEYKGIAPRANLMFGVTL